MMIQALGEKKQIKDAIPDEIVDEKLKTAMKLFQWVLQFKTTN